MLCQLSYRGHGTFQVADIQFFMHSRPLLLRLERARRAGRPCPGQPGDQASMARHPAHPGTASPLQKAPSLGMCCPLCQPTTGQATSQTIPTSPAKMKPFMAARSGFPDVLRVWVLLRGGGRWRGAVGWGWGRAADAAAAKPFGIPVRVRFPLAAPSEMDFDLPSTHT